MTLDFMNDTQRKVTYREAFLTNNKEWEAYCVERYKRELSVELAKMEPKIVQPPSPDAVAILEKIRERHPKVRNDI